jgi:hypothetical protein
MNCTINTFSPWPMARKAVPRAAVVLPLPGPVKTMINPFLASGNAKSFPVGRGAATILSRQMGLLPRRDRLYRKLCSAGVGKAPQNGKSPVNLFQQHGPGPVMCQGHA